MPKDVLFVLFQIKGPLKSKTHEQVLKEFNALLNQGVHEVILIAQDLGDYAKERKEKNGLEELNSRNAESRKRFLVAFPLPIS